MGTIGKEDYYIGLDLGTNSVGWAVTNTNYSVLTFHGKAMWGSRLFDTAQTAADRRMHRTSRRRLKRRKYRLDALEEIFREELKKVDSDFLQRLKEGQLHSEDKTVEGKYNLFNDVNYTDYDYHREYPTIYHLRRELIHNKEEHDIRLVYLALHHLMKYRGHFLFNISDDSIEEIKSGQELENFLSSYHSYFETDLIAEGKEEAFSQLLEKNQVTLSDKKKQAKAFNAVQVKEDKEQKVQNENWINLLLGTKNVKISNLFIKKEIDSEGKLSLDSEDFDDQVESLSEIDDEAKSLIRLAKGIYDWTILVDILKGETYLSEAKVKEYDKHKKQLEDFKSLIKSYLPEDYKTIFSDRQSEKNYVAYIGQSMKKNNASTANRDDFYKFVKAELAKISDESAEEAKNEIQRLMELNQFLIKPRNSDNGVIPYQIHLRGLRKILKNAEAYLPFLKVKGSEGLTNSEKIVELFRFRIPYYIGPLNDTHKDKEKGHAWVVRKEKGKVWPWNFDEKIDRFATAEAFIKRMTNHDTYLPSEEVLPKHSLLYQKFIVLNEINNIKFNHHPISVEEKQKLYHDLFEEKLKNVTTRDIKKWAKSNGLGDEKLEVTGVDSILKGKLETYHYFKDEFENSNLTSEDKENIVAWQTLFGGDRKILKEKLSNEFQQKLTEKEIEKLAVKSYQGWGNFSSTLLEKVMDKNHFDGGVYPNGLSIIQALWYTNYNLMELLSRKFDYTSKIDELNQKGLREEASKINYDLVDSLVTSPANKRSIWQALRVVDEIVKIKKYEPKRVFIEMTRETSDRPQRTISRRNQLLSIYNDIESSEEFINLLENYEDKDLLPKKIYLYFLQMGIDLYTGEKLDLNLIISDKNNKYYDIDHIYPRSLTKDDSWNNLVLVSKQANALKSNHYPITESIRNKMAKTWKYLNSNGLMSNNKYQRLIRNTELSDDELSGFIARQLVSTGQITKNVMNLIKRIYPDTTVVASKGNTVSDFRNNYSKDINKQNMSWKGDPYFLKIRSLNNYHHAKDAYLNIVVGNVYYTKFTANPYNFIHEQKGKRNYNLARVFENKVERNGTVAWVAEGNKTLKHVKNTLHRNDILISRQVGSGDGSLFDQTIMKKGFGQIPIKKNLDVEKYGAYNKDSSGVFAIVDSKKKGKIARKIETIPLRLISAGKMDEKAVLSYLEELDLEDPKVIVSDIPVGKQLIEYNGEPLRITGRSGEKLLGFYEKELIVLSTLRLTLKKIDNIVNKNKAIETQDITEEELLDLYNFLIEKGESSLYKENVKNSLTVLKSGKEIFNTLSLQDKVNVLVEILKLFKSNRELSNLSLIGGSKFTGTVAIGKNITKVNSFVLIQQSVTGLYEKRIDVMKEWPLEQ